MNSKKIDFRSDTLTTPCRAMREAMFEATVGDDVFGEDPTVNELQTYTANLFGMEAALFCSSGTQTNQIAIAVHTKPGGEVICHKESHIYKYEGGGIARNSSASVRLLDGNQGILSANDIEKWINPDDVHFPVSNLISLEDTFNRGGGKVYPTEIIQEISEVAKRNKLPLHCDGARIFNAFEFSKQNPNEYSKSFDSISVCLSKGLGAPVGSLLLGSSDFIKQARRVRKVFGGGMRQAGIIAAGGLFALKNNVVRLKEDHYHANQLALVLSHLSWIISVLPNETNIVVVTLATTQKRDEIIHLLAEKNILCMAFGPEQIRFVTHLNISSEDMDEVIAVLKSIKS